jgi:hypothetical protein
MGSNGISLKSSIRTKESSYLSQPSPNGNVHTSTMPLLLPYIHSQQLNNIPAEVCVLTCTSLLSESSTVL